MRSGRIQDSSREWLLCGLLCLTGIAIFAFVVHTVMHSERDVGQVYIPYANYTPFPLSPESVVSVATQKPKVKHEVSDGVLRVASNTAQSSLPNTLPLPRYGADALGAPGAWDGSSKDGTNSVPESEYSSTNKDYLGNPCYLNAVSMSSDALRRLLPPRGVKDSCGYFDDLVYREDVSPVDFFKYGETNYSINSSLVKYFAHNGKWSIADFEELVRRGQTIQSVGALNMYLILKQANSPTLALLLSSQSVNRVYIDEYIKTGECPIDSADEYCFGRY